MTSEDDKPIERASAVGEPAVGSAERGTMSDDAFAGSRYPRHSFGLEFDRISFFCDAVFAIALTIIVVSIEGPELASGGSSAQLLDQLSDMAPQIISFFVAFAVIGRYWIANHRFMALLDEVDGLFIGVTLAFLATIAFLPFPAAVMGLHNDNAVAISFFAIGLAAASTLETLQLIVARRHGLLRVRLTPDAYRWSLIESWTPVAAMLISVPLAFVNPTIAILAWFAPTPIGIMVQRRKPAAFVG